MFRWQKLVDVRGRRWKPCQPRDAMKASGYAREYLVHREEAGHFWKPFLLITIVYISFVSAWDFGVAPLFSSGKWSSVNSFFELSWFLIPGMFMGIAFGSMNKFYGWRNASAAVQAMSRAGLCASCGYRIDEIEPEDDGCTVCPECGAAWRIE